MNCRQTRKYLESSDQASSELEHHLADCPQCAGYRDRHEALLGALGDHHAAIRPPAGFAHRVQARLQQDEDPIGWAALRLLPASLVVILLLSWLNVRQAETSQDELVDPTNAVMTWALQIPAADDGVDQ